MTLRPAARPVLLVVSIVVFVGGCARVAAPPGGPIDADPPRLAFAIPGADSAGVAPTSEVVLVFSEAMDRRSVMKSLRVLPRTDFARTEWAGDTLRLRPEGTWPPGPIHVWLGPQAEDARGNFLGSPSVQRFTTAAAWGTSAISGRVVAGREMGPDARVAVFALPGAELDSARAFSTVPAAIAIPSADGSFRLDRLEPGPHRVVAYLDRDGDPQEFARGDVWSASESAVELVADSTMTIPAFLVGTLDSAGTVSGEVLADSGAVVIEASADSTRSTLAARAFRSGGGPFTLDLPTGRDYFLRAFADADADSALDASETAVELETPVSLQLTSRAVGVRFDIRGATPGRVAPPAPADSSRVPR